MRPVGLTSNAWTNGFGESCAAIVSNNASAGSPSLDSSSTWALRRRSPIAWLLPAKAGGVSRWPARYIRRCRRTGSHPRVSHLWSTSMTRYNIEETAVYDKYVRWCGRTGPRGPSYPIRWKLISIAHPNPGSIQTLILNVSGQQRVKKQLEGLVALRPILWPHPEQD